jgi:purine catabolism regulator
VFTATAERASAPLVNGQYEALERGSRIQGQLQLQVIEGTPISEIIASIADAVSAGVHVFDRMGRLFAGSGPAGFPVDPVRDELLTRSAERRLTPFSPAGLGERSLAVPIPSSQGGHTAGWLLVVAAGERPLGAFEALMTRLSSTVLGLALMRIRTVRETERRLAGDLLADAIEGRSEAADIAGRLESFGFGPTVSVLVFEAGTSNAVEAALEEALAKMPVVTLVATADTSRSKLVCVIADAADTDPLDLVGSLHADIRPASDGLRAAASRAVPAESLRRAFHEARCALEASSFGPNPPAIASHEDLGAFTLLLSVQDEEALRQFSSAVLGPVEAGGETLAADLLNSLEAFIECNGNWERAAKRLFCHRHTLRHRIRKVEEMTGRDFNRASDRIECWLALQARQLVG